MKTYLQLNSLVLMLMFLCVSECDVVCCLLLLLILIIVAIFFYYFKARDCHRHLWRCSDHHTRLIHHTQNKDHYREFFVSSSFDYCYAAIPKLGEDNAPKLT